MGVDEGSWEKKKFFNLPLSSVCCLFSLDTEDKWVFSCDAVLDVTSPCSSRLFVLGISFVAVPVKQSERGLLWKVHRLWGISIATLYPLFYLRCVTQSCCRYVSQHLQVSAESDWQCCFPGMHYSNAPSLLNYTGTKDADVVTWTLAYSDMISLHILQRRYSHPSFTIVLAGNAHRLTSCDNTLKSSIASLTGCTITKWQFEARYFRRLDEYQSAVFAKKQSLRATRL